MIKLPVFDGMAEGLQKGNEICAKNLEKSKQKRLNSSAPTGRKLVYMSKKKGNSGFTGKRFCILMVQTMMMTMIS